MEKNAKIFVAGHFGMVGSAIVRELKRQGYDNLVLRTHSELDLSRQKAVEAFFEEEKPEYVFLAAAVSRLFLHLSPHGAAADEGGLPFDKRAGDDERGLCACQDFGT